jgi:hypothetical protein
VTARPIRIVLDTSAIVAYTHGSIDVGETLAEVQEEEAVAALPIPCLVEAARLVAADDHIDLLVKHGATVLSTIPSANWRLLTKLHRVIGRLDASTAALTARPARCYILTREPGLYAGLEDDSPVIPF